ncbi:MAG: hypothetical protein OEQ75_13655 [Gemmatimonadota bacterium]|nr:hypothetical protein [Gemmatimonadota bacterium]
MLSKDQLAELERLVRELSDDALSKLKSGNIEGVRDRLSREIDPDLIAEHDEMKEIIKAEFRRRNDRRRRK